MEQVRTIACSCPTSYLTHARCVGKLESPSQLAKKINHLLNAERELVKKEIGNVRLVGISYDGSTLDRVEVYLVMARFVSNGKITQRIVDVRFVEDSMGQGKLTSTINRSLGKVGLMDEEMAHRVANITRDGCPVNGAAYDKLLSEAYPDAIDAVCLSHGLSLVGKKMDIPVVRKLLRQFGTLLGNPLFYQEWLEQTNLPRAEKGHKIRW